MHRRCVRPLFFAEIKVSVSLSELSRWKPALRQEQTVCWRVSGLGETEKWTGSEGGEQHQGCLRLCGGAGGQEADQTGSVAGAKGCMEWEAVLEEWGTSRAFHEWFLHLRICNMFIHANKAQETPDIKRVFTAREKKIQAAHASAINLPSFQWWGNKRKARPGY